MSVCSDSYMWGLNSVPGVVRRGFFIEKHKKIMGYQNIESKRNIVKVSLVGVGMRSHAGIASKMFKCLAKNKVNIRMISTSEIKISVVIDQKNLEIAVQALHNEFKLEKKNN